jgi:hypothetical protein
MQHKGLDLMCISVEVARSNLVASCFLATTVSS